MTLSGILSRIIRGHPEQHRLAEMSQTISEAQEKTRYNSVAIDSGDRALRNMSGMMRLLMENDGGKTER
ncbi:hypothetical protein NCHU2750_27940 [Neorhizobium sp. NCHU2750]|nr:hypothetical protein NCHU2750_27940 [Neorhizobium sp. NCHU2750]